MFFCCYNRERPIINGNETNNQKKKETIARETEKNVGPNLQKTTGVNVVRAFDLAHWSSM